MNKKPAVYYMQTDPKWKNLPYRVSGEASTIGGSGCGPTSAAMLIQTLTGCVYTPVDACDWSVKHGYKAKGQGTSFNYFKPQFADKNIQCDMLNWYNTYGKEMSYYNFKRVEEMLRDGYYFICCMGPGRWTSGGHFVVLWAIDDDGNALILDPASSASNRAKAPWSIFGPQVKYFWWVDARAYNKEEEKEMTEADIRAIVRDEIYNYFEDRLDKPATASYKDLIRLAIDKGIVSDVGGGTMAAPKGYLTREEAAIIGVNISSYADKLVENAINKYTDEQKGE